MKGADNDFLCFDMLTLVPIDRRAVDYSLLTEGETKWLQTYNRKVCESLKPYLSEEENAWLAPYAGCCRLLRKPRCGWLR